MISPSDKQFLLEKQEAARQEANEDRNRLDREQVHKFPKDPEYGMSQWQIDHERALSEAD